MCGGEGEGVGIGASGGPVHVARIAEQIGRAPKQPHAGPRHLLLDDLHHGVEVLIALGQRSALGGNVAVVKTEEWRAQLLHELEGHANAMNGVVYRVLDAFPGTEHGAGTEGIGAGTPHRVPICHAEAELVLHALAGYHFILVIVAEGQGVLRLRTLKLDLRDFRKRGHRVTPAQGDPWVFQ